MGKATTQVMVDDMTLDEFETKCDRIDDLLAGLRGDLEEVARRLGVRL